MKIVKPVEITVPNLISSSVAEPAPGEAAYAAGTTYALGDRVILTSTHRVYESVAAGNTGHSPDTSPLWWTDVGPTNRWAMFDGTISTGTSGAAPLTVVFAPDAIINALAIMGPVGTTADVTVQDAPGGAVVYTATVSLVGYTVADWYEWFFEPFTPRDVVLTGLPSYRTCVITVAINGAGTVSVGALVVGALYDLAPTHLGAKIGITDYSTKTTDAYGTATFVRRAFAKRMTAELLLPNELLQKVSAILTDLRATPCVWVGTELDGYSPLVVYGAYRDYSLTVSYPNHSLMNLEIEGLI